MGELRGFGFSKTKKVEVRVMARDVRYNVDEFVEELRRIDEELLPGGDDNEPAREAIRGLLKSILIDCAECGCQAEINFKQKIIIIDVCRDNHVRSEDTTDNRLIEDAIGDLKSGKHLISCAPGDGLCRCFVERVEQLLEA
jgi:hypothetical protein